MFTYFYNMAKRVDRLLEAVIEMNGKYDLLLAKLDRMEELLRERE